jgi:predicted O-methyltransferase YrrM
LGKEKKAPSFSFSIFEVIMFTKFQVAKKYLQYYLASSNGKGHGIHSPFVFDFIKHVLQDKKKYNSYLMIEKARQQLLNQKAIIEVEDFGAGSAVIKKNKRAVSAIARSSLKPAKYAQLLFRMVQYYQPQTILELGTSFGVTTSYLAAGNTNAKIYTLEGAAAIAKIAQKTFKRINFTHIELTTGDFIDTLPAILAKIKTIDFVFLDGNHRKAPTLNYFNQLLSHSTPSTILIFDDIHWSAEMEEAWETIKLQPQVTLTIDLFFVSIVFLNPDINHKQHFTIRF